MWLVLFVLLRIDLGKGIGQVLASVVGYVQVRTRKMVGDGKAGGDDTSGTLVRHLYILTVLVHGSILC